MIGIAMLRGRETVRAQLVILDKNNPKPLFFYPITVILIRMRFSSVPKSRLARVARNARHVGIHRLGATHRAAVTELARTATRPRGSPIAHG
jgi:hypothetical protein